MKTYFTISLLILSITISKAQFDLTRNLTPKLYNSVGEEVKSPWVGGLNSVHLGAVDLNQDGIRDLFIYDLTGGRITTYINNGKSGEVDYTYAPEYENKFPKNIESFVQFVDYNQDGKNDLFTYFGLGIKVFKNISNQTDGLKFEDVTDDVDSPYLTSRYAPGPNGVANLYLGRGDVPAITDIDNDGDIDILAFGNTSATVFYHQNLAADSGNIEEFNFQLATSCWGNFEEDFDSEIIRLNISCKGGVKIPKNKSNKHAGSTLLAFDADNDGDKDLLVGDISSNHLNFLTNGGDSSYADMISQNLQYPPQTRTIDLTTFPAAHFLDVNNDNSKDLLITPNTVGSVENLESIWYYQNLGTTNQPVFNFVSNNLLQSEMIDLGAGAFPAFLDYNNDQVPDLVLGNHGSYNGIELPLSSLRLYEITNDGNYKTIEEDIGEISKIILNINLNTPTLSLAPAFGDLDGDGDKDLIIGDFEGKIHYFKNTASTGENAVFELETINYLDIDVGGYASPQLFDLNRDGKLDLIIGERNGNINYYQNTGTEFQAAFTLVTEELGNVDVVPPFQFNGFSYPFFFLSDNKIKLLCGSQSGRIYYYDDIEKNITGTFQLVDTAFGNIQEKLRSTISGEDINGDGKLELVIGNYAGGISLYNSDLNYQENTPIVPTTKDNLPLDFGVYPIPSFGIIELYSNDESFIDRHFDIEIYNIQGDKKVYSSPNTTQKTFDLRYFAKGVYYMKLRSGKEIVFQKFIIL